MNVGPAFLGLEHAVMELCVTATVEIRGGLENEMWVTEILAPHAPSRLVPSLPLLIVPLL